MQDIVAEGINSFASPVVTVPASFLQALQSLQDRISYLESIIVQLKEENAAMAATQAHLIDNQEIQLRLINDLRKEPQPAQRDRAEILRALLVTNGGKMLAKEARQKMGLDKSTFSRLLDTLKDDIESKPLYSDKRKMLLIIK